MKSFDVHIFHTRDGNWKARITDGKKREYVGPANNLGLLLRDLQRHILLRERD